jgi:hypothetical protein
MVMCAPLGRRAGGGSTARACARTYCAEIRCWQLVEADHAALKQGGGSNGCPKLRRWSSTRVVSRGGQMVDPQFRRPDETYVAMVPEWATANAESIAALILIHDVDAAHS